MHTMVQQPNNDYDIDHAIIFDAADLPLDPLAARTHVIDALCASGDTHLFSDPPQRRTNAVTVWYKAGYHVDLAVYRCYLDLSGNEIIEHAGSTEWRKRDPMGMNTWFNDRVTLLSPSSDYGATVDEKQMRRIVQFLKMFTKTRSENMPGGLIISVLVSECYVPDSHRDDVALVETMKSIRARIQNNQRVWNPVDIQYELTDKQERYNQVSNFHDALSSALDNWLAPLFDTGCDEIKAYKTWNKLFKHDYWSMMTEGAEMSQASKFVLQSGGLFTAKPSGISVESPPHKFFGNE